MGLVDVGGAVSGRERRSIHVWSIYTDGPFVSWSTDDQIDLDGWSLAGVHAEQKDRPAARQRTHEGVGIWFGRRLGKWRALARSETQPRTQIITHVPQAFGEKWGSQLKSTCLHARINLLSCHWLPFAFAAARCRANRWRAHFRCSCGSRVGGMSFFACGSSDFCAHNLCGRRMYCRIYIYIWVYIFAPASSWSSASTRNPFYCICNASFPSNQRSTRVEVRLHIKSMACWNSDLFGLVMHKTTSAQYSCLRH